MRRVSVQVIWRSMAAPAGLQLSGNQWMTWTGESSQVSQCMSNVKVLSSQQSAVKLLLKHQKQKKCTGFIGHSVTVTARIHSHMALVFPHCRCCETHRLCFLNAAPCRLEMPPLPENFTCWSSNSSCGQSKGRFLPR